MSCYLGNPLVFSQTSDGKDESQKAITDLHLPSVTLFSDILTTMETSICPKSYAMHNKTILKAPTHKNM